MANYAKAVIFFEGEDKDIKLLQENLLTKDRYRKDIFNTDFLIDKVPGISDNAVFELFGFSYDKYYLKEYTEDDIKKYEGKVDKLIKQNKWLGLKDNYINNSVSDISIQHTPNKLVVKATFRSIFPDKLFLELSKKYNLNLKMINYYEGYRTTIITKDSKNKLHYLKNAASEITTNKKFRNLAVELGLHNPEQMLIVCLMTENFDAAKDLITTYSITEKDMLSKNKFENYSVYGETPLYGLEQEFAATFQEGIPSEKLSALYQQVNATNKKLNLK